MGCSLCATVSNEQDCHYHSNRQGGVRNAGATYSRFMCSWWWSLLGLLVRRSFSSSLILCWSEHHCAIWAYITAWVLSTMCVHHVSLVGFRDQPLDWQTAPPVHVLSYLVLGSEKDAKCWEVREYVLTWDTHSIPMDVYLAAHTVGVNKRFTFHFCSMIFLRCERSWKNGVKIAHRFYRFRAY